MSDDLRPRPSGTLLPIIGGACQLASERHE